MKRAFIIIKKILMFGLNMRIILCQNVGKRRI